MTVSRRTLLRRLLLFGGLPAAGVAGAGWFLNHKLNPHTPVDYPFPVSSGVVLPPTPACEERAATEAVTEGPFYTPDTPERSMLRQRDTAGRPLTLRGRVLTVDCRPLAGAVVDVWSCDGNGVYDNAGFSLRGHQFTDDAGQFAFQTVKPKDYRDFGVHRTPHIHVKVQGRGTPLLTTQLFFPAERLNDRDFFFKESLVVSLRKGPAGELEAWYDFVLQAA